MLFIERTFWSQTSMGSRFGSAKKRGIKRRSCILPLYLLIAISVCANAQSPNDANPMECFARLMPGQWQVTAASGKSMYHTWNWGPNEHSVRRMTDGSGADGKPWREMIVYYWHPGRKQICLLGFSPFARGVTEGTIKLEGNAATAVMDLYQAGGRRRELGLNWTFEGTDKYHETLLEKGPQGLKPLVEFDHIRLMTPLKSPPFNAAEKDLPSELPKVLGKLIGAIWEMRNKEVASGGLQTWSEVQWVPIADAFYIRTTELIEGDEPKHVLDTYLYKHTGTGELRCLSLSKSGGVYEGVIDERDNGNLQVNVTGYEGEQVVQRVVQFDFEADGKVRQRQWEVDGKERKIMFDVSHEKFAAANP